MHRCSTHALVVGLVLAAALAGDSAAAALEPGVAYVASSDALAVVDLGTNGVTGQISLPASSQGFEQFVGITPDGKRAYVTRAGDCCPRASLLAVIDTASNSVVTTIDAGNHGTLGRIAFSPDGTVAYVPFLAKPDILVIDTRTNSITSTISLPPDASAFVGIAVTPDGKFAYGTPFSSTRIGVVDLARGELSATIPVPPCASGVGFSDDVAITPDGRRVYVPVLCIGGSDTAASSAVTAKCVGACGSHTRVTVDALLLGVDISLGLAPLAACPSFDPTREGSISVDALVTAVNAAVDECNVVPPAAGSFTLAVDTDTNQVSSIIDFGFVGTVGATTEGEHGAAAAGASGLAIKITPDGKFAYVGGCRSSGTSVCVIDMAQDTVTAVIPTEGFVFDLAIRADGAFAYATTNEEGVVVIDTRTNTVATTVPVPASQGIAIRNGRATPPITPAGSTSTTRRKR